MSKFKSGFISIIGKPNVGKSTLLNRILEQKIAIISNKPQTTRNKILGIKNMEGAQLIFLDTPGIHNAKSKLNKYMVKVAFKTYSDVDAILLLVEATDKFDVNDQIVLESLSEVKTPLFLIINKIDIIEKSKILLIIDKLKLLHQFTEIIPISACSGENVDLLLHKLVKYLPCGPMYYPEEVITDRPERFIIAELIREKVIEKTHQEIPYSVAVVVDAVKKRRNKDLVDVSATIFVERYSQKGIIIGKSGNMLKEIGKFARQDIEGLLGSKIFLDIWVKVKKDWSQDEKSLKLLGYK